MRRGSTAACLSATRAYPGGGGKEEEKTLLGVCKRTASMFAAGQEKEKKKPQRIICRQKSQGGGRSRGSSRLCQESSAPILRKGKRKRERNAKRCRSHRKEAAPPSVRGDAEPRMITGRKGGRKEVIPYRGIKEEPRAQEGHCCSYHNSEKKKKRKRGIISLLYFLKGRTAHKKKRAITTALRPERRGKGSLFFANIETNSHDNRREKRPQQKRRLSFRPIAERKKGKGEKQGSSP